MIGAAVKVMKIAIGGIKEDIGTEREASAAARLERMGKKPRAATLSKKSAGRKLPRRPPLLTGVSSINHKANFRFALCLINAHSKKFEHHCHMVALYAVWYNFGRMNIVVRMAPAVAAGISDRLWHVADIAKLIDDAARSRVHTDLMGGGTMKKLRGLLLTILGIGILWHGMDVSAEIYDAYSGVCETVSLRFSCEDISGRLVFLRLAAAAAAISVPVVIYLFLEATDKERRRAKPR